MASSTVLVTIELRMANQEPIHLAQRNRWRSRVGRSLTIPSILESFTSSWIVFHYLTSSLTVWRWAAVGNSFYPVPSIINSMLARFELGNFSFSKLAFLIGIVLKVPTMCGIDFEFSKDRRGKKDYQKSFSAPTISYPVFSVTRWKISILIVSHVPPRSNFPEDISL